MVRASQASHEPLSGERLQQIKAHYQLVAMEGEDRHHRGEPWPEVVGRQLTAIFDLLREVERLTKQQKRGRHAA